MSKPARNPPPNPPHAPLEDEPSAPPSRRLKPDPAEPTSRVSRGWTIRFSLAWVGVWTTNQVPLLLVLPDQLQRLDPHHKIRDFGVINLVVGLVTIVTLPVFGALCDRTRSRLGRRRVWVLGGAAVVVTGLLLAGVQTHWLGVGASWTLATLGTNMTFVGLTAVIADQVPDHQRGMISSAINAPPVLGTFLALVVVQTLTAAPARYAFLGGVQLLAVLPYLLRSPDTPPHGSVPPLTPRSVTAGLWVSPRHNPDFAWAFLGRLLVNLGNTFGTAFLLYYLRDGLKATNPDGALVILNLIYLVFAVVATYASGIISDRTGRRRNFVALASTLQALAALLLALTPTLAMTMVSAALLGAGYGAFQAIDQALVISVLPDAQDRAKDLGIMNVGMMAPQAIGPLAGGIVIASLGGYAGLYLLTAATTLIGALSVYRIRSVP